METQDLPTAITSLTRTYRDISPSCLVDVALGMEPPETILRRYGYEEDIIPTLLAFKPFQLQVEKCRSELTSSGVVFRTKNAMLADSMMSDIYRAAIDQSTTLAQKLDAYRTFAKYGALEPATGQAQVSTGGGIVLNINVGTATRDGQPPLAHGRIIDVVSDEPTKQMPAQIPLAMNPAWGDLIADLIEETE